jgi:hypothetical protein
MGVHSVHAPDQRMATVCDSFQWQAKYLQHTLALHPACKSGACVSVLHHPAPAVWGGGGGRARFLQVDACAVMAIACLYYVVLKQLDT